MRRLVLWLALAAGAGAAAPPALWVPARWEGGPLEAARRTGDKAPAKPEIRDAIERWYDPATLDLLEGSPINCLLLTLTAGADREIERRQLQFVREYARRVHQRGLAVLGLVYPGAEVAAVAAAAADAGLDGVVLEGEFPGGPEFARRVESLFHVKHAETTVFPIASGALMRRTAWPVAAVEGVSPGVGKADDSAEASATGGLWVDSNQWLVRSLRAGAARPVWVSHRPRAGSPGIYARSIADASAAGARWIVALDDELRARLLRREPGALEEWKVIGRDLAYFEKHREWNGFEPFGKVAIAMDTASGNSEEYLNLVARRQIPYRVVYRQQLDGKALDGMRAVVAFDLAPASDREKKILREFAAKGGLVLTGPGWGGAPRDQSYTIVAEGEGEIAVYKEASPDPQSVARDLNDLVSTPDLGVSVFKAPSVLSCVSTADGGRRMLIQLVNYATAPAQGLTIWITGEFGSARLDTPEGGSVELPVKRRGSRTEITVPALGTFGAVLVE